MLSMQTSVHIMYRNGSTFKNVVHIMFHSDMNIFKIKTQNDIVPTIAITP